MDYKNKLNLYLEIVRKSLKIKQRVLNIYYNEKVPIGRVLFSYRPDSIYFTDDDFNFQDHSNIWESAQIIKTFNALGFIVDAIWYNDIRFKPKLEYDIIFDIHKNITKYATSKTKLTIFYSTGSYASFSNNAELKRIKSLEIRKGIRLKAKRYVNAKDIELYNQNLYFADQILLIGNTITLNTFPYNLHKKITLINPTSNFIGKNEIINKGKKEFLWFNGYGAIHKGLDLVLEVFKENKDLILNIVGSYEREKDFLNVFKNELYNLPNVKAHGFLLPSSEKFREIVKNVIAFISPTCSEGVSTSSITCMQFGLIPIISEFSGISIPNYLGETLKDNSIKEISKSINKIANLDYDKIIRIKNEVSKFANEVYSRENYVSQIFKYLNLFLLQK